MPSGPWPKMYVSMPPENVAVAVALLGLTVPEGVGDAGLAVLLNFQSNVVVGAWARTVNDRNGRMPRTSECSFIGLVVGFCKKAGGGNRPGFPPP